LQGGVENTAVLAAIPGRETLSSEKFERS